MPIDYKKYPPNWKSEIVPKILLRAGNRCEICGLENKQTVFSGKLWVRDGRRYKYKTLWFGTYGGALRVKDLIGEPKHKRVVLTVAHLDHDELNHDVKMDRLKAMCQYCHLNYDAKEKYRRACNKGEDNKQ